MAHSMLENLPDHDHGSPSFSRPLRRPAGLLRRLQLLAALALVTVGALITTSAVGCKPAFCVGGYVRTVNGAQTCEGLCSSAACANPGNVCVNNLCALQCKADADCPLGQDCLAATPDGSTTATTTCQNNGRSAIGFKCPEGNECAKQAPSCPDGSNCDFTQCGGNTCSPDPVACGSDAKCTIGLCDDSTPCTVQGCTMDKCKALVCLSAGVGDAEAYCTLQDCTGDANCPGGYACDKVRDSHPICGAAASKLPGLCGISCTTAAACVTAYGAGSTCTSGFCEGPCVKANAGDGTTYAPGPFCTFRNQCRVRRLCDPCTTDLDCSVVQATHCSTQGGSKFCASDCATDTDCSAGYQCPSGECSPRAGSCTGKKTFCEPCHTDDTECGAGLYCSRESSLERVCVAPIGTINCTSDAQCPKAASGLNGKCMDATVESQPGDGVYHTCWLPYFQSIDSFQCWANNTGADCGVDADCLSKHCLGVSPVSLGTCM